MGRLKKYKTEEERKEAKRKWNKTYYWKNKKEIDKKSRERYWKKKNN